MNFINAVNELRAGRVKRIITSKRDIIADWKNEQIIFPYRDNQNITKYDLDADWQPVKEKEESLSDLIAKDWIHVDNIKKTIKKLKELVNDMKFSWDADKNYYLDKIDSLFGKELVE